MEPDTVLTRLEELQQRLAAVLEHNIIAHLEKQKTCMRCKYISDTGEYCGLGLETFTTECSRKVEMAAAKQWMYYIDPITEAYHVQLGVRILPPVLLPGVDQQ